MGVPGLMPPSQSAQRHVHNVDGSGGADRSRKWTRTLQSGGPRRQASGVAFDYNMSAAGRPALLDWKQPSGVTPWGLSSLIPTSSGAYSTEALKKLAAASLLGAGGAVFLKLVLAPDGQVKADRTVLEASKTSAVAISKNIQLKDLSAEAKVQSAAVYMDTPATTPVDSRVLEKMAEIRGNFGNPSSSNLHGTGARQLVDASRSSIAQAAGAKPEEVIFTSGATEGANAVFYALGEQFRGDQPHQIVSAVEHKAILHPAQRLEEHGWQKTLLPVNADGLVADVAKYLTASTRAVFIQMVNNETGVRQPVEEIAKVIKRYNPDIFVIVDAAQAFGKCPINFDDSEVDAMLTSGHKIHAPKGVGALIAKPRVKALLKQHPLLLGGGQEGGMRAGTENVDGIVGFGVAARLAAEEHTSRSEHVNRLSKNLVKGIQAEHPEVKINGSKTSRLPNIISLRIPRVDAGALNMELGKSLSYSTSSACNGGVGQSHVLKAMGVDLTQNAVMRLGISYMTTEADIEETIRQVNAALAKMKQR